MERWLDFISVFLQFDSVVQVLNHSNGMCEKSPQSERFFHIRFYRRSFAGHPRDLTKRLPVIKTQDSRCSHECASQIFRARVSYPQS